MGNINFKMGFQLDRKGLNEAKSELAKITKQLETGKDIKIRGKDLDRVKSNVASLDKALDKAFDKDLNKLNLKSLNAELKKSGISLDQLQRELAASGVAGTNAFQNIHREVLKTGVEAKKTKTIISEMADTLVKTAKWNLASGAINTFQGSVQRAVGYVKSMDESLNNIRVVTGKSSKEMEVFVKQANEAAKSLGKTTQEYSDASLIFFQQGKSAAEVRELTEATLIGANITGSDTTDMADYLTAVMNGYVIEANRAMEVTDKLAAVGAATGADFRELAIGMSKVASAANVMEVPLDNLNAMLATVTTVTREAPETIGTTFKTIFTRMSELKSGKEDEEGWTTGKVEEALNMIDVSIIDKTTGKMRDMGDVMNEVGDKWATLNRESQIGVSVAMAGQRQSSRLIALFENWDMYKDAVETSQGSMGAALEQNTVRMDSLEYKTKQLRAESEELWGKLIDNDALIFMTESITTIVGQVNDLIDGLGGLGGALGAIGGIATNVFSKQLSDGIVKAQDKLINFKDKLSEGMEGMKTGKPAMNASERAAKGEIESGKETGAISDATAKTELDILDKRVKLRKQEEVVQKNLNGEQLKSFQVIKNSVIQEQEKLKTLVREREEIAKAAKQNISEGKYKQDVKDGATLVDIEQKIAKSKEGSLKLEQQYTKELKVIEAIKTKGFSIDDLQYMKLKQGTSELTNQEKTLLKILERNEVNVDTYTDIDELVRDIDEVFDSINDDLETQQSNLEEIYQTELDIKSIRSQENEEQSDEMIAIEERIGGLEREGGAIEENAKKHAKVQTIVQGLGVAMGVVSSLNGLKTLGDDAATAEDKVNAINSSLMGVGTTLLSTGNPYLMVAGGVAMLGGGLVKLAHDFNPVNRATKENTKILEEQNKVISEAQQRTKDLMGIQSQFKLLQEQMSSGTGFISVGDLDTEGFKKYAEIANDVASVAPQLVSYYDEMGNAIIDLSANFDELIEKEKETVRLANAAKASNVKGFAVEYENTISEAEAQIAAKQRLIENIGKMGSYGGKDAGDIGAITAEINSLQKEIQETQGKVTQDIIDPIFSGSEAYSNLTKKAQGYSRELVDATKVSQKMNDPEALESYTKAVDRFMGSLVEKNKGVADSIENVESRLRELEVEGVAKDELAEYETLKNQLEELEKKIEPVSEAFDKLGQSNKQNVIEASSLIQDQVKDYDTLINKLSEYYGDTQNMLIGPMQSSELMSMGGLESGYDQADAAEQEVANIDAKLLELADSQGELRIARDELVQEMSASNGGTLEQIEQFVLYGEQIDEISAKEQELLSNRTDARYVQQEAHAAMIEEAMLQAEMNEMYDQQINAMLETTDGYNQIAEGVNGMVEALDGFSEAQALVTENMSSEAMDGYINSLSQYADTVPGLSDALDRYKTEGASAFDSVRKAAGEAFADMERQAEKLYLSLNRDNAQFYTTFLNDNKNMTKLVEIEYGVRAQDFKTYADYETALDKAKMRGKIHNLSEEQKSAILAYDNIENAYWNSATGQLETSNALSGAMQTDVNHTGQTAISAYSQMRKSGVSVADSIRYAFAVMVDRISGGWANMVNSLIDALNSMLQAGGTWANKFIDLINKIPGVNIGSVDWGNISHISGTNYASGVADSIADKYGGGDDYDWNVNTGNTALKPPGGGAPGFGGSGSSGSGADGPGISSGGDKGGGKDSGKEGKEVEDLEWEEDIYHDINIQLEQKQQLLDKLQKQQDKLYGKALLDNLAEQRKALQDQQKLLEKKLELQKKDLEQQKQDLSKQGVKLNVDGTISNYNDLLKEKLAYVNSLSGEAKEAAKEEFQSLIDMMEGYEDMLMNSINETETAIQESIDAQREIFLQEFDYKIEVQLELTGQFDEAMDFQKDFFDSFEDSAENYERTMSQLGNKMGEIQAIQEQLANVQSEDLTDKERLERLDELNEQLKDATLDAKKLSEELTKIYTDTLKEGLDIVKEHADEYKRINDEVKHMQQMMKLLGKGQDFETLDAMFEAQYDNLQGQINVLNKQKDALLIQKKALEDAGMVGSEEWKALNDAINNTQKDLDKLTQDTLKVLQDEFKNSVDAIMDGLDKALSGGMGLDNLKKEYDKLKKSRKEYLDIEEKITEVGKLQSKINKDMAGITDPKKLEALQKFKDKELAALKEKDKLTKYDIDRANLMYDITLKQMALEDQKNAKNLMRLVRDAAGNWVYEFVEDNEAVIKAREELSDSLEKLQEMDKKQFEKAQEDMIKAKLDFEKEIRDIIERQMKGEFESDEAFKQALDDAQNKFNETMKDKSDALNEAQQNGVFSSLATILMAYQENTDGLGMLAGEQEEMMKQLASVIGSDFTQLSGLMDALNSGNSESFLNMAEQMGLDADVLKAALETITGDIKDDWGGNITDMIGDIDGLDLTSAEAIQSIMDKWKEYQDKLNETTSSTGNDLDSLKDRLDDVNQATEDLGAETDALIGKFSEEMDQLNQMVQANAALKKSYEDITKEVAKQIAELDALIQKQKEVATGVDKPGGGGGGNPGTGSGSGGSSGGGGGGTPPPPPPPPTNPNFTANEAVTVKSNTKYWANSKGQGSSGPARAGTRYLLDDPKAYKPMSGASHEAHISNSAGGDLGWVKKSELKKFKSGGYTGAFSNDVVDGKLAILHEKELVLNKDDTKNMLDTIKMVRGGKESLNSLFASVISKSTSSIVSAIDRLGSRMGINPSKVNTIVKGDGDIKQTVSINADFSGVKNSNEIEKAFDSLAIQASQYASKRR